MSFSESKFGGGQKDEGEELGIPQETPEINPEERLKDFLIIIAERLKKEGIPVMEDCRINMDDNAFKKVYGQKEVENDKRQIEELQKKFKEEREMRVWGKNPERIIEEEEAGEKLESLKTGIFSKFLGTEFIVARTSLYDDINNKIDNVVLEKKTGNLVCALDEIGAASGPGYEGKKEAVLRRNRQGGGKLKYGFRLEGEKLTMGKVLDIPIFYLALSKKQIENGTKVFIPSFENKSDFDKNLFTFFSSALNIQIDSLREEPRLNPKLRNRICQFEKTLQGIKI